MDMKLFGNRKPNSGTAGGGFTLTGVSRGKHQVKATRREWSTPPAGRARFGAKTRRPGQDMGGTR